MSQDLMYVGCRFHSSNISCFVLTSDMKQYCGPWTLAGDKRAVGPSSCRGKRDKGEQGKEKRKETDERTLPGVGPRGLGICSHRLLRSCWLSTWAGSALTIPALPVVLLLTCCC